MSNVTSAPEPIIRTINLTPEMAEELLSRNPRNRKISRSNYNLVRRAIENGEWKLNGEAIKVSEGGEILDGQHRCLAVKDTGITIRTVLIENLPVDTQDTMDTGKSRSLSDVLAIRGEVNVNGLAANIKKHLAAERYGFLTAFTSSMGNLPLTNRECLDWLDANPWVREYVIPGKAIAHATPLGGALSGFLMRTFDNLDAEDSAFFWARLVDGLNLGEADPIYALRKTFKTISDDTRGEKNQKYLGALVIKAWNAFRAGEEVRQLRFRIGGANPENFPEPR